MSSYSEEARERAYDLAVNGDTDVQIADGLDISMATFAKWEDKHPEFRSSIDAGRAVYRIEDDRNSMRYRSGSFIPMSGTGGYVFVNSEAAAVAASYTTPPTDARKALIDAFWTTIKAAGIPATLDRLFVKAAADSQAGRVDWMGGTSLTPINSPAFVADRGFTSDGSTSYLDTGYNLATSSVNLNSVSAAFSLWSRTDSQETSNIGIVGGTAAMHVAPRTAIDQISYRLIGATQVVSANANSSGLLTIMRTASGATEAFRNGVSLGTNSPANGTITNGNVFLLGLNSGGVAVQFSTRQYAAAAIGGKRTPAQELALYNALQTYMTAVGA